MSIQFYCLYRTCSENIIIVIIVIIHSMSRTQSIRTGQAKNFATTCTVQVCLLMFSHKYIEVKVIDLPEHYLKWLTCRSERNSFFQYLHKKASFFFQAVILPHRKTIVHRLLSSAVNQKLQAVGPTKSSPVLPQLSQGFHHLYTHIEYECASQYYHHFGSARRTCLKTGKWSGRHVSCSPGEGTRASLMVMR